MKSALLETPVTKTLSRLLLVASVLLGGFLLLSGWRRWFHFLIDFGRELYIPWRLSEGESLYLDLAYFNGPLSPYFNSLLFRFFGADFSTLLWANLAIALIIAILCHRLIRRTSGDWSAALGVFWFVSVFALSDLAGQGNYNYLAPYSHEMTHGMLLSLVLLATLAKTFQKKADLGRQLWFFVTGLVLGLLFLTKVEFFVAAATAWIFAIAMGSVISMESVDSMPTGGKEDARLTPRPSTWLPQSAAAALGFAACLMAALVWLTFTIGGFQQAASGLLSPWSYASGDVSTSRYYLRGMGLLDPAASFRAITSWLGLLAAAIGPGYYLASKNHRQRGVFSGLLAAGWSALCLVVGMRFLNLSDVARPLPFLLLGFLIVQGWHWLKGKHRNRETLLLLTLTVFGLLLLLKILFRVRFHHYGFVLAVPGTLALLGWTCGVVPERLRARGRQGRPLQWSVTAFCIPLALIFLSPTLSSYDRKVVPFGEGDNRSLQTTDAELVREALVDLPELLDDGDTLLVLPEGPMLNFLVGAPAPTGYLHYLPPELSMFGEEEMLNELSRSPPDVVLVVDRDLREYSVERFGRGYAEAALQWIVENYDERKRYFDPEKAGRNFGLVVVLERRVSQSIPLAPINDDPLKP